MTRPRPVCAAVPGDDPFLCCDFRVVGDARGESYRVSLSVDGEAAGDAELLLDLDEASRLAQEIAASEGVDLPVRGVGSQLYDALFGGALGAEFQRRRAKSGKRDVHVHLTFESPPEVGGLLDDVLAALPWEAMCGRREVGFLAPDPRYVVTRSVPSDAPWRELPGAGPLRILLVVPELSGLVVSRERSQIESHAARVGAVVELLEGSVTAELMEKTLAEKSYDIVHFIGHGRSGPSGSTEIRLNKEKAADRTHWVPGEAFANWFIRAKRVRLVVLNCCRGGEVPGELAGIGPWLLARAGVPAVVAMQYDVENDVATTFADALYGALFHGQRPGRIDAAVNAGILRLHSNYSERAFITPVLFLAPGSRHLFDLRPAPPDAPSVPRPPPARGAAHAIPDPLLEAIRAGLCIPVIGPGILEASARRSGVGAPGPAALAQRLAAECGYPGAGEVRALESAGSWLALEVLPRVCQYYVRSCGDRAALLTEVQSAYPGSALPVALAYMAGWRCPGAITSYFDGFFGRARGDRGAYVVNLLKPPRRAPSAARGGPDERPYILVNLRGDVRYPPTAVLTESEHETIWRELEEPHSALGDLLFGSRARATVLFIGTCPSDRLVRRLFHRLVVETGQRNDLGPIYFAGNAPSEVDLGYWVENYDAKPLDLGGVLDEIADGRTAPP